MQRATAEKLNITKELLIQTLWKNHLLALEGNPVLDRYGKLTGKYVRQIPASNRAIEQISEMLGFKMDRNTVMTVDLAKMTESELRVATDDLERQIAELKAKEDAGTVH